MNVYQRLYRVLMLCVSISAVTHVMYTQADNASAPTSVTSQHTLELEEQKKDAIALIESHLFQSEESALWKELEHHGVTQEDVQAYYDRWASTMRERYTPSSDLPVNENLDTLIRAIHASALFKQPLRGIRALPVIPAPATVCLGYLYANPQKFLALSTDEQMLVVLHLLASDYFDDAIVLTIIEDLTKLDRDAVERNHPLAKLCRLMQLRAALVACAQVENGAEKYAQIIQEKLDRREHVHGALHPSHEESLQLALEVQKYLKNQG